MVLPIIDLYFNFHLELSFVRLTVVCFSYSLYNLAFLNIKLFLNLKYLLSPCSQHTAILGCSACPCSLQKKSCIRYFYFPVSLIFWWPFFLLVSESVCIISTDFTNNLFPYASSHTNIELWVVSFCLTDKSKNICYVLHEEPSTVTTLSRHAICKASGQYPFSWRK